MPAEFGLTPKVDAARTTGAFYSPGAIIDAEILQPENPIFYGYDKKTIPVRYGNGPLLTVQTGANPFDGPPATPPPTPQGVLMRYPGGDDHVLSGLMRGANEIRNRPAIVDQPSGKGRVILFAGNPMYRWQNFGEFNMLFNTVLNFNDIKTENAEAGGHRAGADIRVVKISSQLPRLIVPISAASSSSTAHLIAQKADRWIGALLRSFFMTATADRTQTVCVLGSKAYVPEGDVPHETHRLVRARSCSALHRRAALRAGRPDRHHPRHRERPAGPAVPGVTVTATSPALQGAAHRRHRHRRQLHRHRAAARRATASRSS